MRGGGGAHGPDDGGEAVGEEVVEGVGVGPREVRPLPMVRRPQLGGGGVEGGQGGGGYGAEVGDEMGPTTYHPPGLGKGASPGIGAPPPGPAKGWQRRGSFSWGVGWGMGGHTPSFSHPKRRQGWRPPGPSETPLGRDGIDPGFSYRIRSIGFTSGVGKKHRPAGVWITADSNLSPNHCQTQRQRLESGCV